MRKAATFAFTIALAAAAAAPASADKDPIRIGYYSYSDVIFTTHVVEHILKNRMDREVELTKADTGAIYQSVAEGDLDFFTESWLPDTHSHYVEKVVRDVWSVGSLYTGARLGWVVPDYVPEGELDSIEDLKSAGMSEKLDGKIVGIGPGAGLTKLSKKAMTEYGLKEAGYELQISSGAGMTAALKRAIENEEWVVVTGWSPHWKFARWDLRYIEDPKGVITSLQHVDTLVHRGFYREHPEVFEMITRMKMPLQHVQWGMNEGEQSSYPEAARKYVEKHPDLVEYWVTGELPGS